MAIATDNLVPLTGDARIDGLTQGSAWQFGGGSRVISYSFSLNDNANGGPWTTVLKDAVRRAFDEWAHVANITFVESGSGTVFNLSQADIAIAITGNDIQTSSGSTAVSLGIFPSPSTASEFLADSDYTRTTWQKPEGDIAIDNYYPGFDYLNSGGVGFTILIHEIGHALGLKHPFDDGGNNRPTFAGLGLSNQETNLYTIMSYRDPNGAPLGINLAFGNAATPMMLDIFAIQRIYGMNASFHTGDDIYQIGSGSYASTIWDSGGSDTIFLPATIPTSGTIDLREGGISTYGAVRIAIAFGTTIENAFGGIANDILTGNSASNRLDGGSGNDNMSGGTGNDTYVVDSLDDVVIEVANEGFDSIETTVSLSLPNNVERLVLLSTAKLNGTGNELANMIIGNTAPNLLLGGGGDDFMDGGGGLDDMRGGPGNDIYVVSDVLEIAPNTFTLSGDGAYGISGTTVIPAAPTQTLLMDRDNDGLVDYIFILGSGYSLTIGSNQLGQNLAVGNYPNTERAAFASPGHPGLDFTYNGGGSNTAFGDFHIGSINIAYGTGQPQLLSLALSFEFHPGSLSALPIFGYFNYNTPTWNSEPESVAELSGEGTDEVRSSISYALTADVENLTLTGATATAGKGNNLANVIVGNTADNRLSGGSSADNLTGGGGADTFQYLSGGDSPQTAMDRILDFSANDRLEFAMASGLTVRPGNYTWTTSLDATLNTIRNDTTIQNAVVSFTDSVKEYVYVKGAGNGVNFDGTLIELAANTLPPTIADQHSIDAFSYSWKTHALLSGVSVSTDNRPVTTDTNGTAHWVGYLGSVTGTGAARAVPTDEIASTNNAVNLQDAIAILKMIVGLNVNGDGKPLSAYQAIAADFDHNGAVNLNDAIGVLKHVVGLDAPAPTWQFFHDTDATMAARANLNPGIVPSLSVNLADSGGVGLVGVLLGDVDGSFVSPTSAPQLESLHVGYFAQLAANHGINLSQFGIYPP